MSSASASWFWPRPRPRPRMFVLGLGLEDLSSALASRNCPRLTSLVINYSCLHNQHQRSALDHTLAHGILMEYNTVDYIVLSSDDGLQMSLMVDLLIWNLVKLLDSRTMVLQTLRVMRPAMMVVMPVMMMMIMMMKNLIKVYILNAATFCLQCWTIRKALALRSST